MKSAITKRQRKILESLVCERLGRSAENRLLLRRFKQSHTEEGIDVLGPAVKYGFQEDKSSSTAYYVVKTRKGEGLFFFSLKCGEIFQPLTAEVKSLMAANGFDQFVTNIRNALVTAVDLNDLRDEIKEIIGKKKKGVGQAVLQICEKYGTKADILDDLREEEKKERNKRILRVFSTYSGIQLVHFCKNVCNEYVWDGLGLGTERSIGEVLFWWFIVPILQELRKLVGCEYAFLFAADASENNSLVKFYAQSLGFNLCQDFGVSKPFYDWTCSFMSMELKDLERLRKRYFDWFNSDRLPFAFKGFENS